MKCSQIKAILFEYTDTEIPVEYREDVEAHLAVCESCARQLAALREQSYALRALPRIEAPGDFLEKVRSRVERPSVLLRLKNRLPVLFAGKHFFQLAGAAATAVLVIATAQVVLRDSDHKALLSPAPSQVESPPSVQAPASVGSPPPVGSSPSVQAPASVGSPAAEPAMPKSLPDIGGENGKTHNRAATAATAAKPRHLSGVEAQAVSITLKLPGVSPKLKSRGGGFKQENFSASSPAAGMRAPDARRLEQDVSKGVAGSAEVSEGSPPPEAQKISSDVIGLIKRANGKVLSVGPAGDENRPETLSAEMPAANYHSFLDQLRQLGEIEFNGNKEFSPAPDSKVRVSVGFATQE
jgi:hypothetical protein